MEATDIKKIKDLEDENSRLKQMFADLSLECRSLKDAIEKSFKTSDKCELASCLTAHITMNIPVSPSVVSVLGEHGLQSGKFKRVNYPTETLT